MKTLIKQIKNSLNKFNRILQRLGKAASYAINR